MASPPPIDELPAPQSNAVRAIKDIAFGSAAGMVSKIFEYPFDLTKVRLQSQVLDTTARFKGPWDCLKTTWAEEGILGLYRGVPAPVVGAMAENASLFLSYNEFQTAIRKVTKRAADEDLPLKHLTLAAAGAGAVTSFVLTPIELVKCKMQVQMLIPPTGGAPAPLPGPISVFLGVLRQSGLRGLWLGQTGTLIRETGGTAAWFGTKEYVARLLLARRAKQEASLSPGPSSPSSSSPTDAHAPPLKLKLWESAFSGACAGIAFNVALFPADTVKSAIQTEYELHPGRPPSSFFRMFMEMYRAQGVRGLYTGCGVTIVRSVPSSAIIFLIYDELNKLFG
ncbi:mitochondrial carrier [Schizophyllum commune H4-8]|uniref:Mitochondrial carrier n=1 Tax=Schizophyllum commune (strain H4-8 / FGSC 9210) TaxID=578458 RepID=D8PZY7_SCHCM|nr:mitochondrial carrier [Schizophyllum commune H4-8]KAI5896569.1 mitochondrial carrier [Schizophyllum commune H4-8]